jgi:hypothetical protein
MPSCWATLFQEAAPWHDTPRTPTGAFVIAGLAPGQYIIAAKPNAQALGVSATDPLAIDLGPSADVTAVEGGVHNVALELKPRSESPGGWRSKARRRSRRPPLDSHLRTVTAWEAAATSARAPRSRVSADGSFTVSGASCRGRYESCRWVAIPAQLARVSRAHERGRQRPRRASTSDSKCAGESIDWLLTMRDRSASIEGTLQSARGSRRAGLLDRDFHN